MDRRTFIKLGSATTVVTATAARFAPWARARDGAGDPALGIFRHGVASGDPLPDRIVLWTRITPSPDATPGSGRGGPTPVAWDLAADPSFGAVVACGVVITSPDTDHTVHIDATALMPATAYWYRFRALGQTSAVGRTSTAPATDAAIESLRLGVVSCSNWEGGYFTAYRALAARDDLDGIVHLGEYIYEYGAGGYGPGIKFGRVHEPPTEITRLRDYRQRHAQYKTDPDLQALHARYPWIVTWDDHEVADNAWRSGAVNHQPGAEGDWAHRRAAAFKAYFEWMPVRPLAPNRIYRGFRFGSLAELFMLDQRTYKDHEPRPLLDLGTAGAIGSADPAIDSHHRTMLGAAQRAWLYDGLLASTAAWKLIGNPVMFAPLYLSPSLFPTTLLGALNPILAKLLRLRLPVVLGGDSWDGYRFSQKELVDHICNNRIDGVVVLTGDIHTSVAADIPIDPPSYPRSGSAAVEFVGTAVTSDTIGGTVGLPPQVLQFLGGDVAFRTLNPWIRDIEIINNGFGVVDVDADRAQYDWWFVSDRTNPNASAAFNDSFQTLRGHNHVTKVGTPLPPRQPIARALATQPTP